MYRELDVNVSLKEGMLNRVQDWFRSRLQPAYLRLLAGAVVLIGLALAVVSYATSQRGSSAVGIPWGADFAGFYVAAQILDHGDASKLYDRELHARLYHELLPDLPKDEIIPYVHPPFVAGKLRLLTFFSYDTAVVIWLVISMALYVGGVLLVLQTCPLLDSQHRWLVLLLAVSFEPFLFETWLGGQLSAVAFFSYALAWYFWRRGMAGLAGMALGMCWYKPTLLLLLVPMLLIARLWKVLLGMTVTGLLLLFLSTVIVGWDCTFSYVDVLLSFRKAASGEVMAIRTWKYVDFNHFFQLVMGNNAYKTIAWAMSVMICLWLLAPRWWRWKVQPEEQAMTWAMTLFMVPLVNIYVGIYDSILVVQAAIIGAELILALSRERRLLTSRWPWFLLMLAVTPWFSQSLAKAAGVQVYSLVLLICALQLASMHLETLQEPK